MKALLLFLTLSSGRAGAVRPGGGPVSWSLWAERLGLAEAPKPPTPPEAALAPPQCPLDQKIVFDGEWTRHDCSSAHRCLRVGRFAFERRGPLLLFESAASDRERRLESVTRSEPDEDRSRLRRMLEGDELAAVESRLDEAKAAYAELLKLEGSTAPFRAFTFEAAVRYFRKSLSELGPIPALQSSVEGLEHDRALLAKHGAAAIVYRWRDKPGPCGQWSGSWLGAP